MKNEEKAKEIANNAKLPLCLQEDDEIIKALHKVSKKGYINTAVKCGALLMAHWKDEQQQQTLIDLNCKLEEQQTCYEELKKRYDEAVERERIATKIINELRERNNKTMISDADRTAEDYRKFPAIREI